MTVDLLLSESVVHAEPSFLVCLLPVRNAEADLPGYLKCVSTFCDAIVALDDGSTDSTYEILSAHPLVKVLLQNPVRPDYRGWDDAANRNQTIAAAEMLNPTWLISLDADERIDERDAMSLREFLQTDAISGFAYGFREVPMRNDFEHFLPNYRWIYRLFSAASGQRFPNQKLHFIPIPTSIPRHRWIRTTLRIQHLGGLTAERRLTRFNKYLESDPGRVYQEDYGHLLASPAKEDVRRWQPRPEILPVLLESGAIDNIDDMQETSDTGIPSLSAIIIAQNNEDTIAETVASVVGQDLSEPFEVIVVTSGTDRTAKIVREQFPEVTLVELTSPALPGDARNAGLAVARGGFLTFPGSHIELLPGSLAARIRAHRLGYAMVSGVVTNGTPTPAGWASYFLDQSEGLPGHGPAEFDGPPGACSYARLPLLEVGGFPEGVRTGEDTAVNKALVKRGYVAFRDPKVQFIHRSRCTTPLRLWKHHFQRGRGQGRILLAEYRESGHLLHSDVVRTRLIAAVPKRLQRIEQTVALAREDIVAEFERHRALVVVGAVAAWAGSWYEVVRPTPGKLSVLFGKPVVNLLIAGKGGGEELALVQIDYVASQTTMRPLSSNLMVRHNGRTVALMDLLGAGDGETSADTHTLPEMRLEVGAALNVDDLECIVASDVRLSCEAAPRTQEASGSLTLTGSFDYARWSVGTLRALRRGTIQSTMSSWSTVRVLNRLHRLTRV